MKDIPDEINASAVEMMNAIGKASFPATLRACAGEGDADLFVVPILVLAAIYEGRYVIASCSFHKPEHTDKQVASILDRVRGNIEGEYKTARYERRYRGDDEIQ